MLIFKLALLQMTSYSCTHHLMFSSFCSFFKVFSIFISWELLGFRRKWLDFPAQNQPDFFLGYSHGQVPIVDGCKSYIYIYWLVVDLPLWKMMEFVNGKDDIPYMKWKIKLNSCLKPPTSYYIYTMLNNQMVFPMSCIASYLIYLIYRYLIYIPDT